MVMKLQLTFGKRLHEPKEVKYGITFKKRREDKEEIACC